MSTVSTLNLIGMVSPFCLMEFKNALSMVRDGQVLEVLIRDPAVVDDVVRLVAHSSDRLVELKKDDTCYHLMVLRTESTQTSAKEDA